MLATCLLAGFCWTHFFDPEDGGDMFLRNIGWNSTDYTASYPRRWWYSSVILFSHCWSISCYSKRLNLIFVSLWRAEDVSERGRVVWGPFINKDKDSWSSNMQHPERLWTHNNTAAWLLAVTVLCLIHWNPGAIKWSTYQRWSRTASKQHWLPVIFRPNALQGVCFISEFCSTTFPFLTSSWVRT
jgi:hypothetical protein